MNKHAAGILRVVLLIILMCYTLTLLNGDAIVFPSPCRLHHSYRQPGLLCTSLKNVRKKVFFGTKVTSEEFLSISQNLKATRLQVCTQTKL